MAKTSQEEDDVERINSDDDTGAEWGVQQESN